MCAKTGSSYNNYSWRLPSNGDSEDDHPTQVRAGDRTNYLETSHLKLFRDSNDLTTKVFAGDQLSDHLDHPG